MLLSLASVLTKSRPTAGVKQIPAVGCSISTIFPLWDTNITMEHQHVLLGKLTISTGPCSIDIS